MSYQNQEEGHRHRMPWSQWPRGAKYAVAAAAAIVFIPAFLALFGGITMWLWNWLMPAIFKLPVISFWQAVGILVLSHLLFKGNHFKGGKSHWKKREMRRQVAEDGPDARPA